MKLTRNKRVKSGKNQRVTNQAKKIGIELTLLTGLWLIMDWMDYYHLALTILALSQATRMLSNLVTMDSQPIADVN